MSTQDIPVPFRDLLAKIATPSKPVSAWVDELNRAAMAGEIHFLYKAKRGKRYLTERALQTYLSETYNAVNMAAGDAVRQALNA